MTIPGLIASYCFFLFLGVGFGVVAVKILFDPSISETISRIPPIIRVIACLCVMASLIPVWRVYAGAEVSCGLTRHTLFIDNAVAGGLARGIIVTMLVSGSFGAVRGLKKGWEQDEKAHK